VVVHMADPILMMLSQCLFGGSLIIDALASHYKRAYPNGLPSSQSYEGQPKPVGPLVYSIQAVRPCVKATYRDLTLPQGSARRHLLQVRQAHHPSAESRRVLQDQLGRSRGASRW
jgi:hypothetical protein